MPPSPIVLEEKRQTSAADISRTPAKSSMPPQTSVSDDRFLNENVREALPLGGGGRMEVLLFMSKSQEGEC